MTSATYGIIDGLDDYITRNADNDRICLKTYYTYMKILKQDKVFTKVSGYVNITKKKHLKKCISLCSNETDVTEESLYFEQYIHTIMNVFVDVLIAYIQENETSDDPLCYIGDRWQSLHTYWVSSNRQTALDDSWIKTMIESTQTDRRTKKMLLKMFVLVCVFQTEVLDLQISDFTSLPQYNSLYRSIRNV